MGKRKKIGNPKTTAAEATKRLSAMDLLRGSLESVDWSARTLVLAVLVLLPTAAFWAGMSWQSPVQAGPAGGTALAKAEAARSIESVCSRVRDRVVEAPEMTWAEFADLALDSRRRIVCALGDLPDEYCLAIDRHLIRIWNAVEENWTRPEDKVDYQDSLYTDLHQREPVVMSAFAGIREELRSMR